MTITLFVVAGLLWYASGISGFIYWWTRQHDLEVADLAFSFFVGFFLGPLTWWPIGWLMHGDVFQNRGASKIIIRKRTRGDTL